MDEDVKLNLEQAQEKWLVKRFLLGFLALLTLIGFWVHDCNMNDETRPCVDATFDPAIHSSIRCDDPRQTMTVPAGWTWIKCVCPTR